jgi:hypothetical protein
MNTIMILLVGVLLGAWVLPKVAPGVARMF